MRTPVNVYLNPILAWLCQDQMVIRAESSSFETDDEKDNGRETEIYRTA